MGEHWIGREPEDIDADEPPTTLESVLAAIAVGLSIVTVGAGLFTLLA